MARISFHRLARKELNDAARYYELEHAELGNAFLDEVEHCVESIRKYPSAAPVIRGNVRRKLIRRFPYALLYSVKPRGIRILAIMNLKRRPMYWVGRGQESNSRLRDTLDFFPAIRLHLLFPTPLAPSQHIPLALI